MHDYYCWHCIFETCTNDWYNIIAPIFTNFAQYMHEPNIHAIWNIYHNYHADSSMYMLGSAPCTSTPETSRINMRMQKCNYRLYTSSYSIFMRYYSRTKGQNRGNKKCEHIHTVCAWYVACNLCQKHHIQS